MFSSPKQPAREILGNADALIKPYFDLASRGFSWKQTIDFGDGREFSVSQIARAGKILEIGFNLPGLFLADSAWEHHRSHSEDLTAQRRIAREILSSVENKDHHFGELVYLAADQKDFEKNIDLKCALAVTHPFADKPHFGLLTVKYSVPERDKLIAAPRIARSLRNIVEFCTLYGTQRTIEALADRALNEGGILEFPSVDVPIAERLTPPENLDKSLPEMVRPSELAKDGAIGRGLHLVEISDNRIVLRIPCLQLPEEKLPHLLNDNKLAASHGIVTSYVETPPPSKNPRIQALLDGLEQGMSTTDSPYQPSRSTRKEPGYWRIEVPCHPGDINPGLKVAIQYLVTFREALRRARLHLESE